MTDMMNEEQENPNDLWAHAQSAEDHVLKIDRKAELEYMRDIFFNKLPLGENVEPIREYFNRLEELIDTTDGIKHINNEKFEEDRPDTDYKYFSNDLFKIRSSGNQLLNDGQDVDDSTTRVQGDDANQPNSQVIHPLQCIPEHPTSGIPNIFDESDDD
jgi:hypothetical protein